jgi:hypothetical protein
LCKLEVKKTIILLLQKIAQGIGILICLGEKNEALEMFKHYKHEVEN